MRIHRFLPGLLGAFSLLLTATAAEAAQFESWQFNARQNRLIFQTDEGIQPRVQLIQNPTRLVIDLPNTRLGQPQITQAGQDGIEEIRIAQLDPATTRIVIELRSGYNLNPEQVQVRSSSANRWVVQLPALEQQADAPLQTPAAPPVVTHSPAATLQADTRLEAIRVTPDGFFFQTTGETPDVDRDYRNRRRQLVLKFKNTALSPDLVERNITVDRYQVNRMQLAQTQTEPPVVTITMDLEAGSPKWRLSASRSSGVALVPAGGFDGNVDRTTQNLTTSRSAQTPASQPVPSQSVPVPTTPTPAPDLPNVGNQRILVVLDPGHGGRDPGAVGINGLRETDIVLPIAQRVAELLEQQGARVILTRQDEREIDLEPRVQVANRANANVFVSIHANSISLERQDINGIETYFYSSAAGRQLAQAIQTSVTQTTGMRNIGVKEARFYVLRRTAMPSSLVEVGFVTGRDDAPRLADANFRDRIAEGIARGILQYIQQNF